MTGTLRDRLGACLFIGAAALSLAACGATIKPDGAAQSVTEFVSKNTKAHAENVKCPDGIDAKVGTKFDCTFTAEDGDYLAHMTINKVDGELVLFNVETEHVK
jgi:hypothetical protein